ncbi:hypothetical protein HYC85_031187 [Camellia sinensis]|uniref:Sugar transporter SWEET1 n=1 Tax=Camellia sinensis TaxID=4442 RepID=A0A7J7FTT9_CAMSI|nr:hypothetical protein HYC85_031187 [Camellia sinensis]
MAILTASHMASAFGILGQPSIEYTRRSQQKDFNRYLTLLHSSVLCYYCTMIISDIYDKAAYHRLVIKTKSVEYMPFALSFFLTLCAIMWFFYGFLIKDYYIATPNILGFAFGIAQMALYIVYKDTKKQVLPVVKLQDLGHGDRLECN